MIVVGPLAIFYLLGLVIFSFFNLQYAITFNIVISVCLLVYARLCLWMHSSLKPKQAAMFTEDEMCIFERYATVVMFPGLRIFLVVFMNVCGVSLFLSAIFCAVQSKWLVVGGIAILLLTSFKAVARLSPEFLKKNGENGNLQQQEEWDIYQSMLSKLNIY